MATANLKERDSHERMQFERFETEHRGDDKRRVIDMLSIPETVETAETLSVQEASHTQFKRNRRHSLIDFFWIS